MLGWMVQVFPKNEDFELLEDSLGYRRHEMSSAEALASWRATLGGMEWSRRLEDEGLASCLAQNGGYPLTYEADTASVLAAILPTPPGERSFGQLKLHRDPEDWPPRLILDFWDES